MNITIPTNEPTLIGAVVSAGLTAAAGLGLKLTPDQIVAVATVVTLVVSFFVRNSVTPVAKP